MDLRHDALSWTLEATSMKRPLSFLRRCIKALPLRFREPRPALIKRRSRFIPRIEILEDRVVPTLTGTGTNVWTTEGNLFTANVADCSDTDSMAILSGNVNWGDGTSTDYSPTFTSDGMGGYYVQDTHTYAEAGNYSITTNISDSDGNNIQLYSTANVSDPMLSGMGNNFNAAPGVYFNTTVATFTDPSNSSGIIQPDYSASVNWGDGTATDSNAYIVSSGMGFNVNDSHTYSLAGMEV